MLSLVSPGHAERCSELLREVQERRTPSVPRNSVTARRLRNWGKAFIYTHQLAISQTSEQLSVLLEE